MPWPVQFKDATHRLGNVMAQFQPFGSPYFHGGCDLLVKRRAQVVAPVSGWLEAGHYGYVNRPDGSSTKVWKPWPAQGDSLYFEVAVVTDQGHRFEFHHVDRANLPAAIVKLLNQGSSRVEAGTVLGSAVLWPMGDYHHIHYNIVTSDGVSLNPEHYSELLSDSQAPEVRALLAVDSQGRASEFGGGQFDVAPAKFVAAVVDHLDQDEYEHPPAGARLRFESGMVSEWDFTRSLTGPDGKFPPIWDVFVEQIRAPDGSWYSTEGGYGVGLSVIQVQVPQGARGPYTLEFWDQAGNFTSFTGRVK